MTFHATEEAFDDEIYLSEIERAILKGRIIARQRDRITQEIKYLIHSPDYSVNPIEVVAKFGPVGELFIITVYPI